jgi:hypothetical protein
MTSTQSFISPAQCCIATLIVYSSLFIQKVILIHCEHKPFQVFFMYHHFLEQFATICCQRVASTCRAIASAVDRVLDCLSLAAIRSVGESTDHKVNSQLFSPNNICTILML